MITKRLLDATDPKLLLVTQKEGSSNATTFVTKGIYKIGTENDFKALFNLRAQLGERFDSIFPGFKMLAEQESEMTVQLEYVGDANMEIACLSKEGAANVLTITQQVIAQLESLASFRGSAKNSEADIMAIEEAFRKNTTSAGMPLSLQIKGGAFIETPIHNDLTVTNIMIAQDGRVRFIDPRITIPGSTIENESRGCPAIDHAAFRVSLHRKNLERRKLGFAPIDDSIKIIDEFVERQIANGFYSRAFYAACAATCYSVYAACACAYCTAPERRWLWEEMKQQTMQWQEANCESNHG